MGGRHGIGCRRAGVALPRCRPHSVLLCSPLEAAGVEELTQTHPFPAGLVGLGPLSRSRILLAKFGRRRTDLMPSTARLRIFEKP
eukprot:scaffold10103_cov24-Tisochrysis_lutea.AAC.2